MKLVEPVKNQAAFMDRPFLKAEKCWESLKPFIASGTAMKTMTAHYIRSKSFNDKKMSTGTENETTCMTTCSGDQDYLSTAKCICSYTLYK